MSYRKEEENLGTEMQKENIQILRKHLFLFLHSFFRHFFLSASLSAIQHFLNFILNKDFSLFSYKKQWNVGKKYSIMTSIEICTKLSFSIEFFDVWDFQTVYQQQPWELLETQKTRSLQNSHKTFYSFLYNDESAQDKTSSLVNFRNYHMGIAKRWYWKIQATKSWFIYSGKSFAIVL